MSVSFNAVPSDSFVPFTYVEFDSSRAMARSAGSQPYRALLIGPKLESGTKPVNTLIRLQSPADAEEAFGSGSILHHMALAFFRNNRGQEVFGLAVPMPHDAAPARIEIALTGSPQVRGALTFYLGGRRYQVTVKTAESLGEILAAVVKVIGADPLRYVDATTNDADRIILTARHPGEIGNGIDLRLNYFPGESLPRGFDLQSSPPVLGTGTPDLTSLLKAIGDEWLNVIAWPYLDETSLLLIEAELEDRWGPHRPIDGHLFTAASQAPNDLITNFNSRNSKHVTITAASSSPSPSWEWAAAIAGINATEAEKDPARPYQTLPLSGIMPARNPLAFLARDSLLKNGIATTVTDASGVVRIERLITTYKRNAAGAPDRAYLDITTKQTLSFLRFDFRTHFMTKFPRHKLADDGTRFGTGQAVMTPKTAKAEAIAKFNEWEERGLVESADQFKRELIVERNRQNPNRLDFLMPPDLINQLMITAAQVAFIV